MRANLTGGKPAAKSAGVIGAVVAIVVLVSPMLGYTVSDDAAETLRTIFNNGYLLVTDGVAIVGALIALWGRVRATKQITGVVTAK